LINGGFPDAVHFSLGASPHNIAGLDINGNTSTITAIVGDKYGNPVPKGTAVYFTTDIGIVNTSTGFTDDNGFASATLFSANPRQLANSGYGYVKAATIDDSGRTILDSTRVLFSGNPDIVVDSVSNGGSTPFAVYFHVWDQEFHHPLAPGTTISIACVGASAIPKAILPVSIMPDVLSGFTTFSVQVIADIHQLPFVNGPFTATIAVSGPNGAASYNVNGTVP